MSDFESLMVSQRPKREPKDNAAAAAAEEEAPRQRSRRMQSDMMATSKETNSTSTGLVTAFNPIAAAIKSLAASRNTPSYELQTDIADLKERFNEISDQMSAMHGQMGTMMAIFQRMNPQKE
ncbi:hypothetical protein ACJ72_06993 [Emergomyces africanus]|uniref:Uncharacterized protein n=1 Tax=Emergomyces africanus TaxID=1955775 RepID=A0A1B7NPZ4_9EURO|nr:hypothetical protein ACJ72_06993 [Emergomyces africanus]